MMGLYKGKTYGSIQEALEDLEKNKPPYLVRDEKWRNKK